jgi:1-deoxy-D-xylulose-5-phosphate reductoisomerase
LTCSGGPFFGKDTDFLKNVKLEDVLKHPTWNMGSKITVDSATLMNKGYELVETMFLFGIHPKNIEIVIHPQSIIHSAVEFADGSVIAQMSNPDMRLPIQYALTYPQRLESNVKPLSLTDLQNLSFYKPDLETFTTLKNMITAADKYYTELYVNGNPNAVNVPAQLAKFNDDTVTDFLKGKKSFYSIFEKNNYEA